MYGVQHVESLVCCPVIAITVIINTSMTLHSDPFMLVAGIIGGYLKVDREDPDYREGLNIQKRIT